MKFLSGIQLASRSVATSTSLTVNDCYVIITATSTLTFPALSTTPVGQMYFITNDSTSTTSKIAGSGTDKFLLGGSATPVATVTFGVAGSFTVVSYGTVWVVVSES